jgi:hypothetical protein
LRNIIYGALLIDQVASEQELRDCLASSAPECYVLQGTTIVLSGRLPNAAHDVTIWGEADTILDLRYTGTYRLLKLAWWFLQNFLLFC